LNAFRLDSGATINAQGNKEDLFDLEKVCLKLDIADVTIVDAKL